MASGKTHDWITVALLGPVFWVTADVLGYDLLSASLITAGTAIGGLLLSPDLDTPSRPFYRWGVLRFIWWPYQWAIRHRSSLSHGIFLAPVLRVIYLSAVLTLLYFTLYAVLAAWLQLSPDYRLPRAHVLDFAERHLQDLLVLSAGIWLGSLAHVILDGLTSPIGGKRRFRR